MSAEIRDQGQIFQTHDILQITRGTFSQTITAGITGQLTSLQLQWNAEIPNPAPRLSLSIASGGNPPEGDTLYSETIDPAGYYSDGIFTWHLKDENLFFETGEKFTLNMSASGLGLVIAASDGLASLAEGGETEGLIEEVGDALIASVTVDAPIGPGETVVATISGKPNVDFISMAAMMIPTNDSFVALNRMKLPVGGWRVRMLQAVDAGTENNDQSCAHIPGAHCGGEGFSVESGEGFVHISDGIHGMGGKDENGFEILNEHKYDWRNPVAKIAVVRANWKRRKAQPLPGSPAAPGLLSPATPSARNARPRE